MFARIQKIAEKNSRAGGGGGEGGRCLSTNPLPLLRLVKHRDLL